MANGTMVAANVYFSDSSTYTGDAGTETNPYCVEDIYDLLAINAYENSALFFMLVENIDFNSHPTYKYGLTTTASLINMNLATLLGNGKEIRNVIAKCSTSTYYIFIFKKVKDLKFLNFINLASGLCPFNAELESCQISGYYSSPTTENIVNNDSSSVSNCSINIKAKASRLLRIPKLINTHFNVDILTTQNIFFRPTVSNSESMTNSYLTGKIKSTYSGNNPISILENVSYFSNSYIATEITVEADKAVKLMSSTAYAPNSTTFVDKELAGITSENEQEKSNLYYLTTEQCKSAEYLESIGFLTVPTT